MWFTPEGHFARLSFNRVSFCRVTELNCLAFKADSVIIPRHSAEHWNEERQT
jgi:hypothetical protein